MKTLKNTSKQALRFADAWEKSQKTLLRDCYKSWSRDKEIAYGWCVNEYRKNRGICFRILSHNNFSFTVGWEVWNSKTGVYDLRIETTNNSYIIPHFKLSSWK